MCNAQGVPHVPPARSSDDEEEEEEEPEQDTQTPKAHQQQQQQQALPARQAAHDTTETLVRRFGVTTQAMLNKVVSSH